MPKLDKILSVTLIIAILAALGGIVYFAVVPQENEKFTEFYILGSQGKAEDYPQQTTAGADINIIVGVANHEYQPTAYRIEITANGVKIEDVDIGTLGHEERWEQEIGFTLQALGDRQRVEFWLYKDGETEPCLQDPLRLYIDVKED